MLLAKRTKPPFQWSFPGGQIEPGESAEDAAIREAREEVSVEIEIVAKAGEREVRLPDKRYLICVFAARLVSGEAMIGPEAAEIAWCDPSEIVSFDATPELTAHAVTARQLIFGAKA